MKTLSQIVATVFVIVGALVLLLGLFEVSRAVLRPEPVMSFFGGPDMSGILLAARLFAGGLMSLQGLMLAAAGLALWLLGEIADAVQRMAAK
jgi:hypothetical protein